MSNRSTTAPRMARSRRGLAMMLVIVALVVGTVIAGVALSTNSLAPQMGANAMDAVQAKWSAESAAEYAAAVLETNITLSSMTDGAMMSDFTIAGGRVDVTVTDMDGDVPDDTDRELIVTAVAKVNGVGVVSRRHVSLTPPPVAPAAADPYLSEFSLFAQNGLTVASGAAVGKWSLSPDSRSPTPVKIGLGFANLASLNINAGAGFKNSALYVDATATASLQGALSDSKFVSGSRITLDVPARVVSVPAAVSGLANGGSTAFTYNTKGTSTVFPQNKKYSGTLVVDNEAELVLDSAVSPAYSFGGIIVNKGAVLRIRGDVDVEVNGSLNAVDKSIIMVEPGGHVDFFVRGNVYVDKSAIGVDISAMDAAGPQSSLMTSYSRPDTVRILSPTSSYANQTFLVDNRGLVAASVHMPAAAMTLSNSATLVGRATGKTINVGTGCTVLADTSLDNLAGFTNLDGPLYQADGSPIAGVVSLLTGLLSILNVNKTAEEFVAMLNTSANASVTAPAAPTDGTTARTARTATAVRMPVNAMVIEGKLHIRNKDAGVELADADDGD